MEGRKKMADFKPITTQEEFDERIKERIERAEKKVREEFKGWASPDDLKTMTEKHGNEIAKLNDAHAEELKKYAGYDEKFTTQASRIHELEVGALKTKIANEKKLPWDAVEFLQGDDEKTISESADKLSKLSAHSTTFTRNTERETGDSKETMWRDLASRLPSKN